MATSVLPSTLLRAFQRFAVRDEGDENGHGPSVSHGLALGVANSDEADAVAIWGVVRDLATSDVVLPFVVRGVGVIGSFTVWVRGAAANADADETTERDAAAAIATQALSATAAFSPRVALVYVHESQRVHLFAAPARTPLALEIVDCAHASDFIAATGSVLLRASLAFRVDGDSDIAAAIAQWKAEVASDDSRSVFFQFPEQRSRAFNVRGERVEVSAVAVTRDAEPLSGLIKMPEQRAAAASTMSKSQKKKKASAQYDNWDVSSTTQPKSNGTSGGDFLRAGHADSGGSYLKTLEYGAIADVQVLRSLAFSPSTVGSPALTLAVSSGESSPVDVHADALVVLSQSTSVADVVAALRAELVKQLSILEAQWTPSVKSLRTHHFALVGAAFPLTLPAVDNVCTPNATPALTLATQFLQSTTQPLFAPASCSLVENAVALAEIDVLFNVHEGIPPSGIPNGTQYLVDGFYGYYHYMQQSMNDKGWGCAYRSLQTLASWLFLNHYTSTPTLSHRKIQQTLVAIGDKPASFVGSREWIGSMEVGFVLDELFGISFRTLNVANGQQLVDKAQELKYHFETQGTPVMMGGGQLAFTLLGIDYNASSGECAFLILDPHYVGGEDLETIQTKTMALEGYKAVPCGWRKASTFSKTSFYNLCLPQRPETLME